MATIAGPKVQMPATLSQMFETDGQGNILAIKQEWGQFFHALQGIVYNISRSGPSSSRPTSTTPWRYVGMPFYDTNLSTEIFLQSVNPDAWVGHYSTHKSVAQTFSTTTLTNDADILIPILGSEHFNGRIFADVGNGLRATGVKVALTAPTGAVGSYVVGLMNDNVGAGNVDMLRASTMGQSLDFTAASIGTALNAMMDISFHVENSTNAGTIHLQFAQSTASTTPVTVHRATQLSADKVS